MTALKSPVMTVDKVQTTMDGDKLSKLISDLDELENRYLDSVGELQEKITQITERIEKLPDERQKQVLYSRYIVGDTWERIAVDMQFYIRHVYRIHGEALKEYAKMALNDTIKA